MNLLRKQGVYQRMGNLSIVVPSKTEKLETALRTVDNMLEVIMETNKVYPLQSNLGKCREIIRKVLDDEINS